MKPPPSGGLGWEDKMSAPTTKLLGDRNAIDSHRNGLISVANGGSHCVRKISVARVHKNSFVI